MTNTKVKNAETREEAVINNPEVQAVLTKFNLLNQKYIHILKGDMVFNILSEGKYQEKAGFYTNAGYSYHTSRTPIFRNKDNKIRIVSSFDCVDGYAYYQNPSEFIKMLEDADKILSEDEIVMG